MTKGDCVNGNCNNMTFIAGNIARILRLGPFFRLTEIPFLGCILKSVASLT